jgi:hypothetical protein
VSKAGGNFIDKNETTNAAHDEAGFYVVILDTTDTNTVGELQIAIHMSGALPVFKTFQVVEEAIYDAFFAASATLVTKIDAIDTVVDAVKVVTDAISTNGSGLSAIPWNSSWDAEVQSEVADGLAAYDPPTKAEMDSAHSTTDGLIGTVDTVVDAVKVVTDAISANGSGLSAIPWNASWDAEVQSEVANALAAYDPPTKAEMDAMWTTAMTESYASDGATMTPAQALYMILCAVSEFAISSTTITGKKLDGSTTAMTWTINSASSPTSRTRAS